MNFKDEVLKIPKTGKITTYPMHGGTCAFTTAYQKFKDKFYNYDLMIASNITVDFLKLFKPGDSFTGSGYVYQYEKDGQKKFKWVVTDFNLSKKGFIGEND